MGFRVLGPFEVAGDAEAKLGGPTPRAILAFLVLRPNEIVPTDTLVHAVWGGRPPSSAMPVVRTYVSRLRRALAVAGVDANLVGRAPGYVLEVDPDDIDAERFERRAHQGRRELEAGHAAEASATLTAALGLWRGAFLADLTDRTSFHPVTARFEDLRLTALEDRIDADLALGRHGEVAGELEALTARHPYRERLWGHRIVALYRSGRQADALAAYREVYATLVDQLGIAPGPELQRLEHEVLRQARSLGWVPPAGRQSAVAPPTATLPVVLAEGPDSRPLVGRTGELTRLERLLHAVRDGHFRIAFIAGPAGIGKTALVARCARTAHADGVAVVLGRADEDLAIPFNAPRGALRQWLGTAGNEQLASLGRTETALLSRLVPELGERRDGVGDPPLLDDDADQQLLHEAIGRWLTCLASRGPAIVVLEDLQWADHATLLTLRHLVRHPPAAGALLVITYRDTELAAEHGLASLVADARSDEHVSHIELGGLGDSEVVELLAAEVVPVDNAGIAFAGRLNRRTGGNPLYIHEVLRYLKDRGAVVPGSGRWPGERDLDALTVPVGVTEVLGRRLRDLPERTTRVLREASVVGDRFDVPVLSRMLGITEVAVLGALEPAVASRLVQPIGVPADDFTFTHSLVRDAIFETIPLGGRPRAHWRAGQAIADVRASHVEPRLEQVARHLVAGVQAGDPRTAIAASVAAGQRAMGALAFDDAAEWFRSATELVARTGGLDPEVAYDAWFGLGSAAWATGRRADHERNGYLQAARIARTERWPARLARAVVGLLVHSFGAHSLDPEAAGPGGSRSEVELVCRETLALLGDTAPTERAILLGIASVLAVRWGRSGEARHLAAQAAHVASQVDDPTALGAALLARCWTLLGGPHPDELAATAERALALPVAPDARRLLHALVLPNLVVAPLQMADRAGFEAARARMAAHPQVRRSTHLAGFLRMLDATIALASGRVDEAEQAAASITGTDEWWVWHDTAEILATSIAVHRGQFAPLISRAGSSLAAAPGHAIPRAMLAALEARRDPARTTSHHVDELRRLVRTTLRDEPPNWGSPILIALIGETAARLESASLAGDLLPVLSDYSGQMLVPYTGTTVVCAADRPVGQALLALGRPEEARQRLRAAHDLERSFGADGLATHSAYWLARAQLACGEHQAARDLLARALPDAERMGLGAVAGDCRELSQTLA